MDTLNRLAVLHWNKQAERE